MGSGFNMRKLPLVTKGPKGLVSVLNRIIAGFNGVTIVGEGGIYPTVTANGWIISTIPSVDATTTTPSSPNTQNASSGTGTGADDDSVLTSRVAALEAILASSHWESVDVMSTGCVRSSIQILQR